MSNEGTRDASEGQMACHEFQSKSGKVELGFSGLGSACEGLAEAAGFAARLLPETMRGAAPEGAGTAAAEALEVALALGAALSGVTTGSGWSPALDAGRGAGA